jgi:N utilization substance protein B
MASRRKGRILAFQALFSWDAGGAQSDVSPDLLEFGWIGDQSRESLDEETAAFARLLFRGTVENNALIDETIQKYLENWTIERLNRVDLAILRMSVYSLMFQKDIAPSIVIDEAIGISREFGNDDSYKFINGVLDAVRKGLPGSD